MTDFRMRTFTGRVFSIDDPRPSHVDVRDIAHHLSIENRYGGAVREPYSVAQHSVIVSENVPACYALEALLHDAAETYLGDLIRGVKRWVDSVSDGAFSELERDWLAAIFEALGVRPTQFSHASIKRVDDRICLDEMAQGFDGWTRAQYTGVSATEPLGVDVRPWSARDAEVRFLRRYKALTA